jgi:hypothetical protein
MAEFRRVFRVQGMDTRINPRFQMVPVRDARFVALHDGAGMTVRAAPSSICPINEITEAALPADDRATGPTAAERGDRFFRLVGHSKGIAAVTAAGSTGTISLDISVKELMTQSIHFYSVRDNAGHSSTRPLAEVGQILPLLNYIFRRQTNIRMVRHGALEDLPMTQNIVPIVVPDTPQGLGLIGDAIRARGTQSSDINVFFVPVIDGDADGAVWEIGSVRTGNGPGAIVLEDGATHFALAHEVGHHLGLPHTDPANRLDIMGASSGRVLSLGKDEVNICNP